MLNIDEINKEINRLENCNCTTHGVCEKLANLYIVRDHFKSGVSEKKTSAIEAKTKSSATIEPTAVKEL